MNHRQQITLAIMLAASMVFAGCAKKNVVNADGSNKPIVHAGQQMPSTNGVAGANNMDAVRPSTNVIYFAFNSSAIDAAGRAVLDAHAAWLRNHPTMAITIEGNCDQRGSREYNLALGQERANAVRGHLTAQGIASSRVDTVSFGEERPACTGTGEACWAQNRHADIVTR
ncbi:MAG: peptidoglycan-associated lipoprotein Pal [Mariprofundales bacterium]|nr:peptidoglycan-associated lipoprotein Pal [Mariprofundales bacterium]